MNKIFLELHKKGLRNSLLMLKISWLIYIIILKGVWKERRRLQEYMEFTDTRIRVSEKYWNVSQQDASGKCLKRTQWDVLKSYFVSIFDLDDVDSEWDVEDGDQKQRR